MKHTHTHTQRYLKVTFFLLTALIGSQVYGQTNETWGTHGNSADSSSFIGTTNDACLRFRSNNIERVRISHDGKVGIGVDSHVEKLDVDGAYLLRDRKSVV